MQPLIFLQQGDKAMIKRRRRSGRDEAVSCWTWFLSRMQKSV